ncbi:Aldehyde dehydrogenase family 3 member B1 [Liparis tanakae]|uniref:Aldehyde dehydrogenase family 3 member B1 n=1 Tax=Liparis tanakae TaxID=230148 RepID=A0A4Z2HGQ0_9TELE|nr:Aldehyde dehydrogenase family 3 member B1 [Liparis tanakae]
MEAQTRVVARLRSAFASGVTIPVEFRLNQLSELMSMITDNEEQILAALHKDLGKPKFEAIMSEVDIVVNELHHTIANLSSWIQPDYVSKNLATKLDDCFVRREALGVVLIIGPWNYPLHLLLLPLVSAIAAGIGHAHNHHHRTAWIAALDIVPINVPIKWKCRLCQRAGRHRTSSPECFLLSGFVFTCHRMGIYPSGM